MIKNSTIKICSMLLLLSCTYAYAGKYNTVLSIGDAMPTFSALPATNGKKISSDDISEDVVVLISIANHCPWSRGAEQDLINLVNAYADKPVRFVAFSVNIDEGDRLPGMKERAQKRGFNFEYVRDDSQELGRQLGATRTPEFYVFDQQRKLVYTGLLHNSPATLTSDDSEPSYTRGEPTDHYVANAIDAVLAGKIVEVKETRAHGCTVVYNNS